MVTKVSRWTDNERQYLKSYYGKKSLILFTEKLGPRKLAIQDKPYQSSLCLSSGVCDEY